MKHLRALLDLIGRDYLSRWAILAVTSVLVGALELIGALLLFALISAMLGSSTQMSWPIVGNLREFFGVTSQRALLLRLGVSVAVFSAVRALFFVLQTYLQHRLAHNAAVRLSTRLFGAYLRMPYEAHLKRNSTVLLRNVNQSVMEIAHHGFVPIVTIFSESLLGLGLATALVISSPAATGTLLLVLTPILFLLLRFSKKAFRRLGERVHELEEVSLRYSQQSLQGIRDVKMIGRESFFERLFGKTRAAIARAFYLRGTLTEVPRVTTETLFMVALGLLVSIDVLRGGSSAQALASIGLMAYAGVRLMPSLNRIIAQVGNFQFATASIATLKEELDEYDKPIPAGSIEHIRMTFRKELRVDGVRFRYQSSDADVLSDVTFNVPKGTSLGIVGPTGAGKSTLLDLLMGLLKPLDGRITVDGVSINDDPRSWHMGVGVVPQTPFLIDDSLRRNVALGLPDDEIDDQKVGLALQRAQLDDFVATLAARLDTPVGERGLRLSGGQRQRLAIARALYEQPDVLFLDEATSALDRVTERKLIADLSNLDLDTTIVMVSHRLGTLSECDQIILLQDGRMIEIGTFDELRQRSNLFREMAS